MYLKIKLRIKIIYHSILFTNFSFNVCDNKCGIKISTQNDEKYIEFLSLQDNLLPRYYKLLVKT